MAPRSSSNAGSQGPCEDISAAARSRGEDGEESNEHLLQPVVQGTSSACPWNPGVAVFSWCATRAAVPVCGL